MRQGRVKIRPPASRFSAIGCANCSGSCNVAMIRCNVAMGSCKNSMGSCNVAMGSCKNPMGSCNVALGSCKNPMGSCNVAMGSCKNSLGSCPLAMVGWELARGAWVWRKSQGMKRLSRPGSGLTRSPREKPERARPGRRFPRPRGKPGRTGKFQRSFQLRAQKADREGAVSNARGGRAPQLRNSGLGPGGGGQRH